MKHKTVVALSLVAVVVVFLMAASSYGAYHRAQTVERARINAATAKQHQQDQEKQATFQQQLSRLEAQCSKDIAAYNALPAATKAKTAAPDCTPQLVQ